MVDYAASASGGVDFETPLDPDDAGQGVPYIWDFAAALGTKTISSYVVTMPDQLTNVSDVKGVASESATYPGVYTFASGGSATAVEVRMKAAAGAKRGQRYEVTVQIVDSDSVPCSITGRVLVADR